MLSFDKRPFLSRHSLGLTRSRLSATRHFLPFVSASLLYLLISSPLPAEHTRRWRQSSYEDFLKGSAHGVAVRSDGRLELAPKFTLLADADASYLFSVRLDPKGMLYAAGGSPAKVFRFDSNAKPSVVFDSTDLSAQAIAFDSKGTLYVGTSPDGKVYKVSATGEKSVFFDPKTKYIWDLAFGPDGTLYVASGDKGQLFAVAPDGKGELFYSSEEAHIRVLAFDANKNLIAGTEPSGRILRISRPTGQSSGKNSKAGAAAVEGFVLYETSKREVTSLAVAPDGSIYASAIGEKPRGGAPAPTTIIATPQGTTTIGAGIAGAAQVQGQVQPPFLPFPSLVSSSIYASARMARQKSSGLRAKMWFTHWGSLPTGVFSPAPATTARFWRLTDAASLRNWQKPDPHKLPASWVMLPERFFCVLPIPERCFRSVRNMRPKGPSNLTLLMRNCSRNGDASNGGARLLLLPRSQPQAPALRTGANREPNSSFAAVTRMTRTRNGPAGLALTPNRAAPRKRRLHVLRSGKR